MMLVKNKRIVGSQGSRLKKKRVGGCRVRHPYDKVLNQPAPAVKIMESKQLC